MRRVGAAPADRITRSLRTDEPASSRNTATSFAVSIDPHPVDGPSSPSPFKPRLLTPVATVTAIALQKIHSYARAAAYAAPESIDAPACSHIAATINAPPASSAAEATCT